MNSFANSLFALLFGWARSLIQRIWSAAAEGRLSGFFTWLGDHWLWVALFICAACTAVDFIVWFIRWQPYKVWQTHMRNVRRFFRGEWWRQKQFEQGYRDAVVPPEMTVVPQAAPAQGAGTWNEMEWAVPEGDRAAQAEQRPWAAEAKSAYFDPQDAAADQRERVFSQQQYELPPLEAPDGAYPAVRRRRSDKYGKKRGAWQRRLADMTRDDVGMLDGLPPAVDREAAFHEPVYPNQPTVTAAQPARQQGRQAADRGGGSGG